MRHVAYLFILCAAALPACAFNESVAAIAYNPSRLGAYTYLKAVQTAKLKGGVFVENDDAQVNVKSKGTVNVVSDKQCTQSACNEDNLNTIYKIQPLKGHADCETTNTACKTANTSAKTHAFMHRLPGTTSLSNTIDKLKGDTLFTATSVWNNSTEVGMKGGQFEATTGYVYEFPFSQVSNLDVTVNQDLVVKNDLYVQGTNSTNSFKFGPVTVPRPSTTATGYVWKEVTDDTSGQKFKVLSAQ